MAAPAIAATNTSQQTGEISSHVVKLPASIAAGDLLIAFFAYGPPSAGGDTTITWPAGWTQLFTQFLAGTQELEARYRIADGGEGTTITLTTGAGRVSAHASYRITGHHTVTAPAVGVTVTGSSTGANPPSLNPAGWDIEDTLWIAVASCQSGSNIFTGFPTSYSLSQLTVNGNNIQLGVAARALSAASDDPGTFTNPNAGWIAQTIAVRPAGAAASTARSYGWVA